MRYPANTNSTNLFLLPMRYTANTDVVPCEVSNNVVYVQKYHVRIYRIWGSTTNKNHTIH